MYNCEGLVCEVSKVICDVCWEELLWISGEFTIVSYALIDLRLFDSDNDKSDALIYLTVQYFRTKKRRDDIKNAQLPLSDVVDFDKIFPIMSLIMALGIAFNLFSVESVSYTLLKIKNDSTFITSDQPVVNLSSELKDENGKTKELEYYYPLSPKHAIKINFEGHQTKYSLVNPDKDEIEKLNNRIISESNSFVFSRDLEYLKNYTQHGV